jgi:hypothetical protein
MYNLLKAAIASLASDTTSSDQAWWSCAADISDEFARLGPKLLNSEKGVELQKELGSVIVERINREFNV